MSIPEADGAPTSASAVTGGSKALVKGMALIDLVAGATGPVRLTDLVDASGLPRPTVLRLLDTLCAWQVLRQAGGEGYVLGPQLAVWGQRYLDRLDVRRLATDLLDRLAAETRETCYLGVVDRLQVLYVAKADSPQAVRPVARVGDHNPLHCTAVGKTLLAFAGDGLVDAYLAGPRPLERRTPGTITDPAALRRELAAVRERGWSIDDIENEEGVRCVSAPVRDHAGRTVAAMSVSAPAYRFSMEDLFLLAPRVLALAGELSARLGAADAPPADLDRGPEP